jgi:hypothetical protein
MPASSPIKEYGTYASVAGSELIGTMRKKGASLVLLDHKRNNLM